MLGCSGIWSFKVLEILPCHNLEVFDDELRSTNRTLNLVVLIYSSRKPLVTVRTGTYHFCKLSLVDTSTSSEKRDQAESMPVPIKNSDHSCNENGEVSENLDREGTQKHNRNGE